MGSGTIWQLSAGELDPCPQPLVWFSLFGHRWVSQKQACNMRSCGEPGTCWMWPGSSQVLTLGSFRGCSEAVIGSQASGYWLQGRAVNTERAMLGQDWGLRRQPWGDPILPSPDRPILFPGEPDREASH